MSDRTSRTRLALYGATVALAVGVWLPSIVRGVGEWREARRVRNNIAIVYTTDTRGFLDACG